MYKPMCAKENVSMRYIRHRTACTHVQENVIRLEKHIPMKEHAPNMAIINGIRYKICTIEGDGKTIHLAKHVALPVKGDTFGVVLYFESNLSSENGIQRLQCPLTGIVTAVASHPISNLIVCGFEDNTLLIVRPPY